jgi:hypothetical protein
MRAYKHYLPPERAILKIATVVFAETLGNLNGKLQPRKPKNKMWAK